MTLILPPKTGEDVSILAPRARLRGRVTDRDDQAVTVELEQTPIRRPFHFPLGTGFEIEWVNGHGVVQMPVTVGAASDEPVPTLVLVVAGAPEALLERRGSERRAVAIPVSAWSLVRPTARFEGTTVDLSAGGALLRLPGLPSLAATLELRLGLPYGPLAASAAIRWRREPDLVGVELVRIDPHEVARLLEFLRLGSA